jgi:hypothetical protein
MVLADVRFHREVHRTSPEQESGAIIAGRHTLALFRNRRVDAASRFSNFQARARSNCESFLRGKDSPAPPSMHPAHSRWSAALSRGFAAFSREIDRLKWRPTRLAADEHFIVR